MILKRKIFSTKHTMDIINVAIQVGGAREFQSFVFTISNPSTGFHSYFTNLLT
jgi:hypothetical protein